MMELPPLASLLRWLAEMPPDFRLTAEGLKAGRPRVRAVIADVFETLYGSPADPSYLGNFPQDGNLNHLGLVMAALHLLWHPAFRSAGERGGSIAPPKKRLEKLLADELAEMAAVVPADKIGREDERSEELIRRLSRAAERPLEGESKNDADDRMKQVDSVERQKVLAQAAERERRARAVREAMAKKAAEEAAAKVGRE